MQLPSSLDEIQSGLRSSAFTVCHLVETYLQNIEDYAHLNAFIEVFKNEALHQALKLDERLHEGDEMGDLFGLVISIKDNICYTGHQAQAASQILDSYTAPYTATALQRLIDQDVIVIGRTNCDEFGMGSTSEHSAFGAVVNGINEDYIAGGSSGGAAVSVYKRMCHLALGSDTGGSIRQPAAFCNTHGLKPTYGSVSRNGLIAYASSFDQIGLISDDRTALSKSLCLHGWKG